MVEHRQMDRGPRPPWDEASDEQILEEVQAVADSGYRFVNFGSAVWQLIKDRGLEERVREILGDKCLTP